MIKEKYEINASTCALIPKDDFSTVIIEKQEEISVLLPIQKVIEYSCAYYGSSYNGRVDGSKSALGSKYKLPIIIEETRELIFFPTLSPENNECIWISLTNLANYKKVDNQVLIKFKENKEITINMSYESFENQVLRATKLLLILKSRKNEAKL